MPKDRERQLENQRKHYQANKELYRARSRAQRNKRREWVNEYKRGPCTKCGECFPTPVMHLHSELGHPEGSLAVMVAQGASEASLRAEAEACVLLCANCHIVTHIERGDFGL